MTGEEGQEQAKMRSGVRRSCAPLCRLFVSCPRITIGGGKRRKRKRKARQDVGAERPALKEGKWRKRKINREMIKWG